MTWGWGGSLTWHFCFVGLLASGPPKRNGQPGTVGVSPRASLECWILCVMTKVNLTGGNWSGLTGYRSNRSGPVSVWAGTKPVQIQNLNLNSKNKKFPKIPKTTSRCDKSNGVKFSQKFVHLV